MGQPKAGTPATIAQGQNERDSLFLVDGGDWFTQDDGTAHLDRRAIEWQRETSPGQWERVSPPAPTVKRTQWDERLPSEIDRVNGKWQSVLKIGPENVGRKFRALVMAGYGPSADAGKEWVEWGAESGDGSGRIVYSNTITVQPFGTPPPPPPPAGNGDAYAHDSLVLAKKALVAWEDAGVSQDKRELTTAWVTVHEKTATAVVKKEIRRLLREGV